MRPRQNGCHFPDDIFKCILLNENVWTWIKISLQFVNEVPFFNMAALVQIMAWRRPGDKPLPGPMMVSLLAHICVPPPQWVKIGTLCCELLRSSCIICGRSRCTICLAILCLYINGRASIPVYVIMFTFCSFISHVYIFHNIDTSIGGSYLLYCFRKNFTWIQPNHSFPPFTKKYQADISVLSIIERNENEMNLKIMSNVNLANAHPANKTDCCIPAIPGVIKHNVLRLCDSK